MKGNTSWTTLDEKTFIDNLGTYTKSALPRIVLLSRYKTYLEENRVNWKGLNKEDIINHVTHCVEAFL